jgi:hypothetical protein
MGRNSLRSFSTRATGFFGLDLGHSENTLAFCATCPETAAPNFHLFVELGTASRMLASPSNMART